MKMENWIKENFSGDIMSAAQNLMTTIDEAVIENIVSDHRFHGMTVFLPDSSWWMLEDNYGNPYVKYFTDIYLHLDFSEDTEWDNFISVLYNVGDT